MARPTGVDTRAVMLFLNNRAILEALTDAERGRVVLALMDYLESGREPDFDRTLSLAFLILRTDVDRSMKRWEEVIRLRSEAGKKGAAARAAKNFTDEVSCENEIMDRNADASTPEQTESDPSPAETVCGNAEPCSTAPSKTKQCSTDRSNGKQCSTDRSNGKQRSTARSRAEQNAAAFPAEQQRPAAPGSDDLPQANPGTDGQSPAGEAYTYSNSYSYSNTYTNTCTNTQDPPRKPPEGGTCGFEDFWNAYPKKVGKEAARRAFARAEVPLERMLLALERQRRDPAWQKENGRFIPNPATWLNQGRWEDEPTEVGEYRHHGEPMGPGMREAVRRMMEDPL